MRFKEFYENNKWEEITIKKCDHRWSMKHLMTDKRYFIKIDKMNLFDSMGSFLREIKAKACEGYGKENGCIDHFQFATNIVKGNINKVLIKPEMIDKIKGTWIL